MILVLMKAVRALAISSGSIGRRRAVGIVTTVRELAFSFPTFCAKHYSRHGVSSAELGSVTLVVPRGRQAC